MSHYDAIVIGAGVIGCSTAFHLAKLGAKRVLLMDRGGIGNGTTAQSSGILRTHYSVAANVQMAQASWHIFSDFAAYLGDDEASAGLVRCGYLIAAPAGPKRDALEASLQGQRDQGIALSLLDAREAAELLPIARFDGDALIGFEPEAGFADAYLVATGFARAARRLGVKIIEGVEITGLVQAEGRVTGVDTPQGRFLSEVVISTQNIWAKDIERWTGVPTPVAAERHSVLALQAVEPYRFTMPVFKDLASPGMMYYRSYGGTQMLASEGGSGTTLAEPSAEQGDIPLDYVVEVVTQVAERFPAFADAGLASSWTGVYDVTPDWNPVLGRLPGVSGLVVGYGFSGHGFKLSPMVGRVLAQEALGLVTDVPLGPYAYDRFARGALLVGRYGAGAVS